MPEESIAAAKAVNGATSTRPNEPTSVLTISAETSVELRKTEGGVP